MPGDYREPDFHRLSIEEGLSQNSIICILQDSKGFLWLGTEDGLNRYDGYSFKTYYHNPNEPGSLSHNRIGSLYEDRSGVLWVGTMAGGLNKFIREEEKFKCYTSDPANPGTLSNNTILSFYEDSEGYLWLGTYAGLNRLDPAKEIFSRYILDRTGVIDPNYSFNTWVTAIVKDRRGRFWLGTSKGLSRFDPGKGEFIHYPIGPQDNYLLEGRVTSICEDGSGLLWIGTYSGLRFFNPETGKFVSLENPSQHPAGIAHTRIETLFKDHADNIWLGTFDGLYKYNPGTDHFDHYRHDPDKSWSLSSNFVISIYEDKADVLWLGTYSGLSKLDNKKKKFTHYRFPGDSLENNAIFSILEDSAGLIWCGAYRGGLSRFDRKTGEVFHYTHNPNDLNSINDNSVMVLSEAGPDSLWIGAGKGLDKFDKSTGKFHHYKLVDAGVPQNKNDKSVLALFPDSTGSLWIGTTDSLIRMEDTGNTFAQYKNEPGNPNSLSSGMVNAIVEDSAGVMWIGTYGGGLNRFDRHTGRFTSYRNDPNDPGSLCNDKIYPLLLDSAGYLWIGTNGGGLSKLDTNTRTFTNYSRAQGLPNHVVLGLLEDGQGNIWISTNGGLSKLNPRTGTFRNYVVDDGLQGYEFFQNSCYKSDRGEMFFGGSNGINAFFPGEVRDNPYIPQVVFTSFTKFNREVRLDKPISEINELKLSHGDTYFSLKFAALDFTAPQRNQYAYRLEGFEKEWIPLGNKPDITFTRLPPGKYTLRVKGSNNDGIWNETGASLKISISSPFWFSGWFKLAAGVLILGLLVLLLQIRSRSLNQKLEKERLKQELTLKADLTAMLVHDLRSPLTAVIGYSQLLTEMHRSIDVPKAGRVIAHSAEKMLTLINDMLDISKFEAGKMSLDRKYASLVEIVNQVIEMLAPLLDRKAIRLVWEEDPGVVNEKLLIDPERIGQVINNLLSNAIKFTPEKGNIIIRLSRYEHDMRFRELSVTDDGPGVPKETKQYLFNKYAQLNPNVRIKGTGLGLAVSRMIVEAHGGIIGYRPGEGGKGSTFYFRVPA